MRDILFRLLESFGNCLRVKDKGNGVYILVELHKLTMFYTHLSHVRELNISVVSFC